MLLSVSVPAALSRSALFVHRNLGLLVAVEALQDDFRFRRLNVHGGHIYVCVCQVKETSQWDRHDDIVPSRDCAFQATSFFLFKNDCGPSPLTKQINSPNYTIRSNQIRYFPHNMCGFRHVPVEAFMFPVEECSRAKGRAFMLRGERTSRVLYLCALRPHIQNRGSYTHTYIKLTFIYR